MRFFLIIIAFLLAGKSTWSQSLEVAQKYIFHERYESAKNELKLVIEKGDQVPDALYWLAEVYLKQDSLDVAWSLFNGGEKAILKKAYSKKESPLVNIGWAHVLLDSGKLVEARNIMENILTVTKYKNPLALLASASANIASKHGDINWAIELLNIAKERDKKNPEIYNALGDAYRKLKDGSNAVSNYEQALRIDPDYAVALYNEGKIYKGQKNLESYLEKFLKAYSVDSIYPPALYELYYHYYYVDVVTAKKYLDKYILCSDPDPQHDYMKTDLLYVSQKFNEAISAANAIISKAGENAQPRMYKLIAYSYAAIDDSAAALKNMNLYFEKQDSMDFVVKDFAMKASLLEKLSPDKSAAVEWYKKAIVAEKDSLAKLTYMISLADLQKELGNRERESFWREKIYYTKPSPTNMDIYKWGLALYYGKDYVKADSVFAIYENKYPDQIHGYLWRARSVALIDTSMKEGLAVPLYKKLIEIAARDSVANKKILLTAYEYLGGYEANISKDYEASLVYFNQLVMLDPANDNANKNIELLKKWVEQGKGKESISNN